ncbi:hypothetical protein LMG31886_01900 [Xanthomonas hydrangeae]|nr:hypothetical protein LMG31886_01900 [Xanthomonas hydrangeae]CAD7720839.1 hypothetical protein LMG31886_01900 [Xanthomonas hydrangeae]CAD7729458.1 hypothetical protein LMG31885_13590 [Xanthomonas hydrangeae]CAD7729462.1 hypothetical protein LMG31885_13590 [Xanthomonas hydrangeae]
MSSAPFAHDINKVEVWLEDQSLGGSSLVGYLTRQYSRRGETLQFEYVAGWLANETPVRARPATAAL